MPKMPPRPCTAPRCKNYATKRGKCDEHQPKDGWTKWSKDQGTNKQRGYGSSWRKKRKAVLYRDSHLCQECLRSGIYTPASQVDHIKPKFEGGGDEYSNLESICAKCHTRKTLEERKRANRGDNS